MSEPQHPRLVALHSIAGQRCRTMAGVAAMGGVSLLVAASALAAIPNSTTDEFSGCYTTAGANIGRLRVIDTEAGATCLGTETRVEWDQAGLTWKGNWNVSTAFEKGDAVAYNGSSYIALIDNTGVAPTNVTTWALMAKKGAKGDTGAAGARGATGAKGAQGNPGVAGPPGAVGATGPSGANGAQGATGSQGPTGPTGLAGPAGPKSSFTFGATVTSGSPYFFPGASSFVAPATATCLVTTTVQMNPSSARVPAGATPSYFLIATARNGVIRDDGMFAQNFVSNGLAGQQPTLSRSAVVAIAAGDTVKFGIFFVFQSAWLNVPLTVVTSYICS